jgi:hypothetical protein
MVKGREQLLTKAEVTPDSFLFIVGDVVELPELATGDIV